MTKQNMKLLDLQTGKYLELGKDWGFFGEFILLNLGSAVELNIKEWGSVSYGDNAYGWHGFIGQETKRPHTDPIVNKIARKTGAAIYGGRYVLTKEIDVWVYNNDLPPKYIKTGDIILYRSWKGHYNKILININDFYTQVNDNHHKNTFYLKEARLDDYSFFQIQSILGNIFEEYSKQLRNEPNKFDELNQHFK